MKSIHCLTLLLSVTFLGCDAMPDTPQNSAEPSKKAMPSSSDYGRLHGDCEVQVVCNGGRVISCGGNLVCTWRFEPNGFVECGTVIDYGSRYYWYKKTCLDEPDE